MKYSKIFNGKKTLLHPINCFLSEIAEEDYHGLNHIPPIKHPISIYNYAHSKIINCIKDYIEQKKEIDLIEDRSERSQKLERQLVTIKELIANICSFDDEAYLIFLSLSPIKESDNKFAFEQLKEFGYNKGANIYRSVHNIIELWREINNRIKHNNQKLNLSGMKNDKVTIDGFFLEGISSDGSITQDDKIHNQMLKGAPALSFERTILNIFFQFYYLSDFLLKGLIKHHKEYFSKELKKSREFKKHDQSLQEIWQYFAGRTHYYFPKEYKLKYPKIVRQGEIYTITYPHSEEIHKYGKVQMYTNYSADGYSRKFHIPTNP